MKTIIVVSAIIGAYYGFGAYKAADAVPTVAAAVATRHAQIAAAIGDN